MCFLQPVVLLQCFNFVVFDGPTSLNTEDLLRLPETKPRLLYCPVCGLVSVPTEIGLDGPGIESRWG
jgi:hypothetical protein